MTVTLLDKNKTRYFVIFLYNNVLFNDEHFSDSQPDGSVVKVLSSEATAEDHSSIIRIYFKQDCHEHTLCYSWLVANNQFKRKWYANTVGKPFTKTRYFCEFNHTGSVGIKKLGKTHHQVNTCQEDISQTTNIYDFQPSTCPAEEYLNPPMSFPESPVNTSSTPTKFCYQKNISSIKRFCFSNGTWEHFLGGCLNQPRKVNLTKQLLDILENNNTQDADPALQKLADFCGQYKMLLNPEEIDIVSKAVYSHVITQNVSDPTSVYSIINDLMEANSSALQVAQKQSNSTDKMLHSFDQFLLESTGPKFASLPKLLVRTMNNTENVTGAMIKGNKTIENFTALKLTTLDQENYLDDLRNIDFEVAFVVPPSFTQNQDHYFVTLFENDNLFNEDESNGFAVGSYILSILIPNVTSNNASTIQIYFKEIKNGLYPTCNHWYYGTDDQNTSIKGRWKFDRNATKFSENIYMCEINHTTHFGILVSGEIAENFVLDLITIFGSMLTVIGIAIVLVTAITFKNWRKQSNNKIILNVSLCLLLLIVLFFVSDRVNEGIFCIVIGICLHYMVLSQLCWMLVMSYSSYRRLGLSLHYHIDNVVLKYCAFSWGVPLVIVGTTASFSLQTYDKESSSSICYPKGIFLKLGLLVPMGIILTINLIVYVLIVKSLVTGSDIRKHMLGKSYSTQKTMFLLFFMLGMTWAFGFLAAFTDFLLFTYLFCATTTFHGFIIFIFYILDSSNTRKMWTDKIQNVVKADKKQSSDTDSTSLTIMSGKKS